MAASFTRPPLTFNIHNMSSGTAFMHARAKPFHHGDLRKSLIAEGLRLMRHREADDLSLREIAQAAKVTAAAFYRHFENKMSFFDALKIDGLKQLSAAQLAASAAVGRNELGCRTARRAYIRFALSNPSLFRLMFSSAPAPGNIAQEWSLEARELLQSSIATLTPVEDKDLDHGLQAWGLVHGLATLMLDGHLPSDDSTIDRLIG